LGVIEISLFVYSNFYIDYFYWFQILILAVAGGYFAFETYRDYRAK